MLKREDVGCNGASFWGTAEPLYSESGELLDGGSDLNMGGVLSVYHDLLYLTAGAQLLSVFSTRAWWLLMLVRLCYQCYDITISTLTKARLDECTHSAW
jgi:hypothetical protein